MQDLRAKSPVIKQANLFGCQRGAVSSMVLGQDAYSLTMGTLGGYVMVYDVRYSSIVSQFRNSQNSPILALATVKNSKTGR